MSHKIDPNSGIEKDTLIIHIHGGGFISMSSASHQSYTRGWAKSMPRSVLCSLDYRLAPESRFPTQLEDTWHAYYWLVLNCKDYFGFEPKKVILTGDSAGGNLVLAITVMAIQRGFRVPSCIVPAYPCTVTTVCEFWPSLLFSLDDPLLSQNFLANCVTGYNQKGKVYHPLTRTNEYLSPGFFTPVETLKKFPRTLLIAAGLCPFKDDNFRCVHNLLQAGAKDVKVMEFRMLPHGFLNMHQPFGMGIPEATAAIGMISEQMEKLIDMDELDHQE